MIIIKNSFLKESHLMLKKLVKYGNSNALILDKAILELLDIEEGSMVKIKTDGKSIIITPHVKAESEKISETFTNENASMEIITKEYLKRYKNLDENKKQVLSKELEQIYTQLHDLNLKIAQNPDYVAELKKVLETMSPASPEFFKANNLLRAKYCPELIAVEKKLMSFEVDNTLSIVEGYKASKDVDEKDMESMSEEFAKVHKKNAPVYAKYGNLLNDPEYQNQMQLIAEKYKDNLNSTEYLNAMDNLMDKYCPEYKLAAKEVRAVSEKYSKVNKK